MLTDTIEDHVEEVQRLAECVRVEATRATTTSDAYEALTHASNLTWAAQELVRDTVQSARLWGMTWEAIGGVFGVSKQAAQQRWG
jgi:hypothetical protein